MATNIHYLVYCAISLSVLKELNAIVSEPYMDEPFHVPQAQAYCRGDFATWNPKITTPPGLYFMSLLIKRIFMFKCTLPMLRFTTALVSLALPLVLTHLLCYHKRIRPPPSFLSPTFESIVLSAFPIAWFFGFLFYTEVPSLVLVASTVVVASNDRHWLAASLGLASCTFRQTNVVWVLYAYASSQLMYLRFRHGASRNAPPQRFYDPPALSASPSDVLRSVLSTRHILGDILPAFVPYTLVLAVFGAFVIWNGGIVLGDKANHIPAFHIPQVYYFIGFSTAFGWPVLLSAHGGLRSLARDVQHRMFGTHRNTLMTVLMSLCMALTVKHFTIHHPFLLSDNRHYTFYLWRRIYMFYPSVPYLLIPAYIVCGWAWFLRVGRDQTLLQTLILPVFVLPTLLPTPLLEPRYFLVPYILLRSQVADVPTWSLVLEGVWYAAIDGVTMGVFLYLPREGVGRFMW